MLLILLIIYVVINSDVTQVQMFQVECFGFKV